MHISYLTKEDFWVPIIYEGKEWVNFYNKSKVEFLPWRHGEPNGKEKEPCVHVMQRDIKTLGYNDYICNAEFTYTICHFQSNIVSYQLRGYHLFMHDFIVEHHKERSIEDVVFQSMWDECQIRKENETWVIRRGHNAVQMAFQKSSRLPVGITEWRISESNQTQLLELTKV